MNSFPAHSEVLHLRAKYPPGTRVELTAPMQDPYASSSQTSLSSTADLSAISAHSVTPPLPTKHMASREPLKARERATVRGVGDAGQILCRLDAVSSLNLIPGVNNSKSSACSRKESNRRFGRYTPRGERICSTLRPFSGLLIKKASSLW